MLDRTREMFKVEMMFSKHMHLTQDMSNVSKVAKKVRSYREAKSGLADLRYSTPLTPLTFPELEACRSRST